MPTIEQLTADRARIIEESEKDVEDVRAKLEALRQGPTDEKGEIVPEFSDLKVSWKYKGKTYTRGTKDEMDYITFVAALKGVPRTVLKTIKQVDGPSRIDKEKKPVHIKADLRRREEARNTKLMHITETIKKLQKAGV